MEEKVLFSVSENGTAMITLNQPKSINSLTYEMLEWIKNKLLQWKEDSAIKVIMLQGAGEKGFCAGGDMKSLYEAGQQGNIREKGIKFFTLEYEVDLLVAEYPKPIIAFLDGVVMGGGVGLSYGADYRIVTERTKWAMPEMNIGFFPDVGAAYFLNQAPGYLGRYLALTSTVINGGEAIAMKAADYFMESEDYSTFQDALQKTDLTDGKIEMQLNDLIAQHTSAPGDKNKLNRIEAEVDEHFRFKSMEEIIASLQKGGSEFAKETADILLSKSPVSLKVTLKQLVQGEGKSFAACLETDLIIASNFMDHADFYEGVRSVLIDKDHKPEYQYKDLADVSENLVNQFFNK